MHDSVSVEVEPLACPQQLYEAPIYAVISVHNAPEAVQ